MAWLTGWSYRKTVTITGQSGAGTDYQVDLSIGDASGGDFHVESHCTSFPNDIQVTDNDQTTPLDYWVEDLTVDPITMWVEVADDLGSNVDVCVYYGKSGESSARNIDNTFLFADDFPGSSVDTGKWIVSGAPTVSGGLLHCSANKNVMTVSAKRVNLPFAYKVRMKYIGDDDTRGSIRSYTPNTNWRFIPRWNDASGNPNVLYADIYSNGVTHGGTNVNTTSDTWHVAEGAATTTKQDLWLDGVNKNSRTDDWSTPSNFAVVLHAGSGDSDGYWDYTFVRKYNSPEPTFSSASSEETEAPTYIPYPLLSGMDGGIGEVMGGGIRR
jgi:hypothetical protein